jgi:hypothetical protein
VSGNQETAKVELAYPMTLAGKDHAPDEVVELPYKEDREGGITALQLVRDGRARWAGDDEASARSSRKASKSAPASATTKSTKEG